MDDNKDKKSNANWGGYRAGSGRPFCIPGEYKKTKSFSIYPEDEILIRGLIGMLRAGKVTPALKKRLESYCEDKYKKNTE